MPELWIPQHIISYDPAMAPVCGGAAPALLFCWFESLFLSGLDRPQEVTKTLAEWRSGVGMQSYAFSRHYRCIGTYYRSPDVRALRALAGHEFWSDKVSRYLFYSLTLNTDQQSATLRRNSTEIERRFNPAAHKVAESVRSGSKLAGKLDARRLIEKVASLG